MCSLGYCHAFLLSTADVDGLELFSLCTHKLFCPSSGAYKTVCAALGIVMLSCCLPLVWMGWNHIHKNVSLIQGFGCRFSSGSHSGVAEDSSLRGCDTGLLGEWFLRFQSKLFLHLHGSSSSRRITFLTAWS